MKPRESSLAADAAGQLRQIVRGLGTPDQQVYATYKYSPNGKQIAVADADTYPGIGVPLADALDATAPHAHQTNYVYDGFDRLISTVYADGTADGASYDANGNVTTRVNRAGEIVSFAYDALNRVVSKALPLSGTIPADTVTWSYDLAGRIVSLSDTAGHTLTNAYDGAGRIVSTATTIPGLAAKTVAYAYDEAGNRTKLAWPDGYSASYAYDAANRMVSAVENGVTALASFDFDNLGRPAAIRYAGSAANDVSLSWSGEGDLLTLAHALSGTAYDVSFTGTYTPAHQIASSDVSNGLYQYVPQVTGTDAYAPDALNRYASVTPAGASVATAIGYDLKGNLTSDGTFSFAYDAENKLMTATKTGTAVSYGYDPLGRRDGKTVNGVATYFLSADAEEIAEYDGAGALLRRYVPGPGTDRPIAMVDGAGAKTFFHQDKTGSVIAMSDAAGNRTEGPYLYDSYGNGAPYTGVPFKFTGRRLDPETGLYYYRARYYCATCGRFLQTDPIGYGDDINWYAYVGNDPTDKTDPSGNCSDVNGCGEAGLQSQQTLNTPEGRQAQAVVAVAGVATVAAVTAPERAAVGGVLGGGASAIVETGKQALAGKGFNGGKIAAESVKGAVTGAVGAATAGAGTLAGAGKIGSALFGATGSAAGAFASGTGVDVATTGTANPTNEAISAAGAFVGSLIGAAVGELTGAATTSGTVRALVGKAAGTTASTATKNELKPKSGCTNSGNKPACGP